MAQSEQFKYSPPNAEEFKLWLETNRISTYDVSQICGVNQRTARFWCSQEMGKQIPYACLRLLQLYVDNRYRQLFDLRAVRAREITYLADDGVYTFNVHCDGDILITAEYSEQSMSYLYIEISQGACKYSPRDDMVRDIETFLHGFYLAIKRLEEAEE
jgi:hypothetical protein